jgi:hypothetical protein
MSVKVTTDLAEIRRWVERRGGVPATVRGSACEDRPGILRIVLPSDRARGGLQLLSWKEFFAALEANELAVALDEHAHGTVHRFVSRHGPELRGARRRHGEPRPKARLDAVTLLERQHRRIEALFEQFRTREDDHEANAELYTHIADSIAAHAMIEETLFMQEFGGKGSPDALFGDEEEHRPLKRVLADLLLLSPTDEEFDPTMRKLEQLFAEHVRAEEIELFAMLAGRDRAAMLELGARMQRVYDQLMQTEPRFDVADDLDAAASFS